MIPFWKKTDNGGKKKPQKPAVPQTAQQSIPMQRMFEDGTCRVRPGYYTRTIQYQDINYQLAQPEDRTAIFEESVIWWNWLRPMFTMPNTSSGALQTCPSCRKSGSIWCLPAQKSSSES